MIGNEVERYVDAMRGRDTGPALVERTAKVMDCLARKPNYRKFAQRPLWSPLWAAALMLGHDPLVVDRELLEEMRKLVPRQPEAFARSCDFAKLYADYQELTHAFSDAHRAGWLGAEAFSLTSSCAAPADFLSAATRMGLHVPDELLAAIEESTEEPSRDELLARVVQLEAEVERLRKASATDTAGSAGGREKETLKKIIALQTRALAAHELGHGLSNGQVRRKSFIHQSPQKQGTINFEALSESLTDYAVSIGCEDPLQPSTIKKHLRHSWEGTYPESRKVLAD